MRIGLLGGAFNPIHKGHITLAQKVLKRLKLDTVFFIPTGTPPHKKKADLAPRIHRLKMVALALQDHPHFKPCDIEIKRKGVSYTLDTLIALKRRYPNDTFFFILGTDAFAHLPTWRSPDTLLRAAHFVIVSRDMYPFSPCPKLHLCKEINRTALKHLDEKKRRAYVFSTRAGTCLYFMRMAIPPITASGIRNVIQTPKNLLPPSVGSYIIQKGLYL